MQGPRLSSRDSVQLHDVGEHQAHHLLLVLQSLPRPLPHLILKRKACDEFLNKKGRLVQKVHGGDGQ